MGFKETFIGDSERYNYGHMCVPQVPWRKSNQKLNFYTKDEPIPIFLAAIMGLQHCFAMVGGLITPPLVVFKFTVCGFPFCTDLQQYAISASLIASGLCTLINVTKFPIPFSDKIFGSTKYVGSGLLSVMGTSFTFLPIFEIAISQMKSEGIDGEAAYGKALGTGMLCCLLELGISFLPVQRVKNLFPPLVTSVTVILIGIALCGTGMKYWGGGTVCAEMGWKTHSQLADLEVSNVPSAVCSTYNGEPLYYGSPEYIGLGFSVLSFLVVIELFGSVFMKNCNVVIALLFGYMIAGVSDKNGAPYVIKENIQDADTIQFLWTETFPLGIYGPAVFPMLIAYLVTTVETVGDLTAVFEASGMSTKGEEYETSVQGGLTSDGFCSILSGLCTAMPNTTFSQNNGVIALTKCASRRAGWAAGCWLILLGVFGKFAGVITAIPDAVLGGMTIFLFANVLASGIALTGSIDLHSRRNKFIMALSLAIGVGVTVWPYAFADRRASPYTAMFWTCDDCNDTMKGIRNGVSIFLSTGYCVGTVIAMMLNAILPEDAEIAYAEDFLPDEAKETKELEDAPEEAPKEPVSEEPAKEAVAEEEEA
eukprot:Nitzschia sp. Nitz4//scaffold238_size30058//23094//25088//NITZ4_008005-RA/size30058-augustus-gene-0.19-mRNA-1//-1//CDS//3329543546//6506//frame0